MDDANDPGKNKPIPDNITSLHAHPASEVPGSIMGAAAGEQTPADPYANLLAEQVGSPDDYGADKPVPGAILVRKPQDGEFLRCHPTFAPRFHVYVSPATRRQFLVYQQIAPLLGASLVRLHVLRLFVTSNMSHFIWAMKVGLVDNEMSMNYARSRDTVIKEAVSRWVSCSQVRGLWETAPPLSPEIFPEPEWPAGDGNTWLAASWRGAIIDRPDHDEVLIRRGVKLA